MQSPQRVSHNRTTNRQLQGEIHAEELASGPIPIGSPSLPAAGGVACTSNGVAKPAKCKLKYRARGDAVESQLSIQIVAGRGLRYFLVVEWCPGAFYAALVWEKSLVEIGWMYRPAKDRLAVCRAVNAVAWGGQAVAAVGGCVNRRHEYRFQMRVDHSLNGSCQRAGKCERTRIVAPTGPGGQRCTASPGCPGWMGCGWASCEGTGKQ